MTAPTPEPTEPAPRPIRTWLVLGVLLVVAIGPHLRALEGGFIWDDFQFIVNNPRVTGKQTLVGLLLQPFLEPGPLATEARGLYRPATLLSYHLDWVLHHGLAAGFHLTNLLLHVANTLLLFFVARRFGARIVAAGIGAGCWAVLPRLTECTAWISGRADELATLTVLVAMLLWPWCPEEGSSRGRIWARRIGVSAILFVGVLFKEVAAAGILGIFAGEACQARSLAAVRRTLPRASPLVGTVVAYAVLRSVALGAFQVPPEELDFTTRVARVPAAAGAYLMMLLDPFRPNAQIGWVHNVATHEVVLGCVFLPALAVCAYFTWRTENPRLVSIVTLSILGLVAVLRIVPLPSNVTAADRYLYLPTAGLTVALTVLAGRLSGKRAVAAAVTAIVFLVACSVVSANRVALWNDALRFWVETGKVADRQNLFVPGLAAATLFGTGFPMESTMLQQRSFQMLLATTAPTTSTFRQAAIDFATNLSRVGRYGDAERVLTLMLHDNPNSAYGHYQLGRVEGWLGKWHAARKQVALAADLGLTQPDPKIFLKALDEYEDVTTKMPSEAECAASEEQRFARAHALTWLGRSWEAEELWRWLAEHSTKPEVLLEAFGFFAEVSTARHVTWALGRLEASSLTGEKRDALRLLLAHRVEAAARANALLPSIREWADTLPGGNGP